ncbi:MAG: alpha/beta fold hydrolase [Clostridia bacterium]|nr:alpha/beta fold hydrolase [Clostridia bacterium]
MSYSVEELKYLSSDDEHKIYAKIFIPNGEVKGIVQICHGMNGYIGKYDEVASYFADQGYVVCGNTHLGHKDSVNSSNELGFFGEFNGSKYLVDDVRKLTQIVEKKFPNKKLFLFGHSMGSFIARAYIIKYGKGLSGVIISATAGPQLFIDSGITFLNTVIAKKGYRFRSEKLYRIIFRAANRQIDSPKNDYAWVSKRAEEFVSSLTKNLFTVTGLRDILLLIKKSNMQDEINKLPKDLPLYFFSGTEDPLGEYGDGVKRAVKLYEKAEIKDITMKLYEGNRHECLSEDNKAEVLKDMYEWIEKINI